MFCGVSFVAACVSGHHVTVCCCTGACLCGVFCDFLVTARWDVRLCVYDGAVCGGVYPGALGATQCVYERGGRGMVCGIDSTLVLRLRAGLWAAESRVPSSAPSLQSLLVPEAESSIQPSPRFRPHGTDPLVSLSVCPFVWLLQSQTRSTSPLHPEILEGAQDARWKCPRSGHRQGTPGPRCITCRGPEWRGRLCGVTPASWQSSSGTRRAVRA